jgi:type VI secretion system protein ImpC
VSAEELKQQAAATVTTEAGPDLLQQMVEATKMAEPSAAKDVIGALVDEAMKGTVTWNKNVIVTVTAAIEALDAALSKQLAAVMHNADFQKLEGTWRGLKYLVFNSKTNTMLKIRVFNAKKNELFKDLDRAVEFDQSQIFKKIYEAEFGTPGGYPYGALIGDYEFTNHPDDVELLSKMSQVSAAAFAPFISAAAPKLFGFDAWAELTKPRDLEKIFDTVEYTKWKSYRESDDSRFVTLVMPRVLARLPYGAATSPVEDFNYEEVELNTAGKSKGKAKPVPAEHYCWMNAAYVLGARLTSAFSDFQWCTAIRGYEGGGRVDGLPAHVFISDDGDPDLMCPSEVGITDRREAELSKCGMLSLCHYKNTDYSVFFGAQTTQKPKVYQGPDAKDATANAAISARLPYIMATSRIAHYLKVMARDWIGSFKEAGDLEIELNKWIKNYVNASPTTNQEQRSKFPLADAKIVVQDIPEKPGSYIAKAYLRPWLQLEELTTSLMMVARIPKLKA